MQAVLFTEEDKEEGTRGNEQSVNVQLMTAAKINDETEAADTTYRAVAILPEQIYTVWVAALTKSGLGPGLYTRYSPRFEHALTRHARTHTHTCLLYTSPSPRDFG